MNVEIRIPDGCRRCIRLAPAGTCSAPRAAHLSEIECVIRASDSHGYSCPGLRLDPTGAFAAIRMAAEVHGWPADVVAAWTRIASELPDAVIVILEWDAAS